MSTESSSAATPATHRSRSEDLSSLESGGANWLKRGLVAIGAIVVVAVASPFLIGSVAPKKAGPRLLHTIERGELIVTVTADGTLQSSSNKDIKCKVKGGSTVLWVIEGGSIVKVGDVLVRLDRSTIEDNISTKEISYQTAKAAFAQSESDVAVAKINIEEYLKGLYQAELKTKEMAVTVAMANLTVAQNTLEHSEKMFRKGFVSELELQSAKFSIEQAQLDLDVKNTELTVLSKYTRAKTVQDMRGILKAKEAKLASDTAGLALEKGRLEREKRQLTNCTIKAKVAGMVVFPTAARWKQAPDIEEGASVRQDQIVLMMPDLEKMQVNVGVPESKVDQLKVGMSCVIELQNGTRKGSVKSIATVAGRSGWWTGNIVKYDTVIKADGDGLKPGMSAKVHIEVARNTDVLTIPVAAVMQGKDKQYACWVMKGDRTQKRILKLGDYNEQFIVVKGGLKEGDRVVLNPLAYLEAAKQEEFAPYKPKVEKKKVSKKAKARKSKTSKPKPKTGKPGKPKPKTGKPGKPKPKTAKPGKPKPKTGKPATAKPKSTGKPAK